MTEQSMQFLYGDRELLLGVGDLLSAPVEVIVSPANRTLQHSDGLAARILAAAGDDLEQQSRQLIREYGEIESGMAVFTSAGELPYRAVIHAVAPDMGEDDEQRKLEQAISRSLLLCEANEWSSIAFPAIGTGNFTVPVEICAMAFFRAITNFWDARHECSVGRIELCLDEQNFRPFFDAFREESMVPDATGDGLQDRVVDAPEPAVGYVDLSEESQQDLDDDEVADWFK